MIISIERKFTYGKIIKNLIRILDNYEIIR